MTLSACKVCGATVGWFHISHKEFKQKWPKLASLLCAQKIPAHLKLMTLSACKVHVCATVGWFHISHKEFKQKWPKLASLLCAQKIPAHLKLMTLGACMVCGATVGWFDISHSKNSSKCGQSLLACHVLSHSNRYHKEHFCTKTLKATSQRLNKNM